MRTRWQPSLTLTTLASLTLMALAACGRTAAPEHADSGSTEAVRAQLATADAESVPLVTQASGSVEPARRISPG